MKLIALIILTLSITCSFAQCKCDSVPEMNVWVKCDTTILKNGAYLYYQFNCDSTWLTFENNHIKKYIFSIGADLTQYNYRLGYDLTAEFKNYLLFRYDCPATGSCNHVLIDKSTGVIVKQLNEIIYESNENGLDLIVYFTNNDINTLTLDFLENAKKYYVAVNPNRFNAIIPEHQFDKGILKDQMLILPYSYQKDKNIIKTELIIDIRKYTR